MIAGKLDRRVLVQAVRDGARDGHGKPTQVIVDLGIVWANVVPFRGDEDSAGADTKSRLTYKFKIRYSSDMAGLKAKDRVEYNSVVYELDAPPFELGRREGLEFTATARAD